MVVRWSGDNDDDEEDDASENDDDDDDDNDDEDDDYSHDADGNYDVDVDAHQSPQKHLRHWNTAFQFGSLLPKELEKLRHDPLDTS